MSAGEYPLIGALHAAYAEARRDAVEVLLATGEPVHLKYADVIDTATGGDPAAYAALCAELVERELRTAD